MPQEIPLYRPRRPGSLRLPPLLAALLVAWALAPAPCDAAEAQARRHGKIGGALTRLYESHVVDRMTGLPESFERMPQLTATGGGYVTIDAVALDGDGEGLLAELEALGLVSGSAFRHMASGRFPIDNLPLLEDVSNLRFARPYYTMPYAGAVQTQGDAAMQADLVRAEAGAYDGSGVTVGAISTSFDCISPPGGGTPPTLWTDYSEDVSNLELPAAVTVLQDLDSDLTSGADCMPDVLATDEGRAMLQHVHDLAPGATLLFHSGANGQADFAQGVLDLRDAGADVIVDDLGVANEPFFQDGIVSQAIDQAVADGVTYLAAGGNWANFSLAATATGRWTLATKFNRTAFDFDPGAGTDHYLRVSIPTITSASDAGAVIFLLHWDQPYASATGGSGASTDLRLWLLDDDSGTPTVLENFCAVSQPTGSPNGNEDNAGADPLQVLQFVNVSGLALQCGNFLPNPTTTFNVFIEHESGPLPNFLQLMVLVPVLGSASQVQILDGGLFPGGGTIFGHANAAGALTIGAANYNQTPEFGQTPPLLAGYSSVGPAVPILFDLGDKRVGLPIVRSKPELICPDGADISFEPCAEFSAGAAGTQYLCINAEDTNDALSYPNFFGTSAAAAHCAGGAALLLEKESAQFPVDVYKALVTGAVDMGSEGFDTSTGWGLVQLDAASASLDCALLDGFNLILTSGSEADNPVTRHACNAVHASGYTIEDTADVTFLAGERVVLGDGFTVESGAVFVAALD